MGMFYKSRCHSKWVCCQIPNTHPGILILELPPGQRTWGYWDPLSESKGVGFAVVAGVEGLLASSPSVQSSVVDLTNVEFPRGGDLVSTLPGCVCQKVKDMGPFSASSE